MKTSSRLERIVPSFELCKLIPEGEFEDSVFVWWERPNIYFIDMTNEGMHYEIIETRFFDRKNYNNKGQNFYPAPTLRELLLAIAEHSESICARLEYTPDDGFTMECEDKEIGYCDNCSEKLENTALKLWLKLKGVEI